MPDPFFFAYLVVGVLIFLALVQFDLVSESDARAILVVCVTLWLPFMIAGAIAFGLSRVLHWLYRLVHRPTP